MQPVDRLVAAALLGQATEVRQMVTADPALLPARDMFGAGAVHAAHYAGQDAVSDVLADLGLVIGGFLAAELGRLPDLRRALAADPGLPARFDERGSTALHAASWRGVARVAQELLDAGADPALTATVGSHRGQTPADTALAQGHLVLATRLDVPGSQWPALAGDR